MDLFNQRVEQQIRFLKKAFNQAADPAEALKLQTLAEHLEKSYQAFLKDPQFNECKREIMSGTYSEAEVKERYEKIRSAEIKMLGEHALLIKERGLSPESMSI